MTTLSTIGYEGADVDAFVYALGSAAIDLVLDIRAVASSRRPGFSKTALRSHLALAGIEYLHLRSLGDPKEGREAARRGDYATFERVFRNHLGTPAAQEDLEIAIGLARSSAVALLCYESDATHCHRKVVADEMAKQNTFAIQHLGVQSERRIASAKVRLGETVRVR